jgi:hypothetical protein
MLLPICRFQYHQPGCQQVAGAPAAEQSVAADDPLRDPPLNRNVMRI